MAAEHLLGGPVSLHPVIALVSSAGGVDALRRVIGRLPEDLPAAVIALMHMDPTRPSNLTDILARRSSMPVVTVEDGMAFARGRVHVIGPGAHALMAADERATLIETGPPPPYRPSADLLLTTMAVALGSRAIVVVLTGHGHDAATGATAVHKFGGTVLASDAASSMAFSMPSATIERDHIIDHVVPLDDIPELLVALTTVPVLDAPPAA
jgi:two-component system, chemotaxis family, protein-glutamate methylesterase/glutaminase